MLENSKKESELTRNRNTEVYSNLLALQKRVEDVDRDLLESREKARSLQVHSPFPSVFMYLVLLIILIFLNKNSGIIICFLLGTT
jgi:hypothetical protein